MAMFNSFLYVYQWVNQTEQINCLQQNIQRFELHHQGPSNIGLKLLHGILGSTCTLGPGWL